MTLWQLRILLVVLETRSFSRAALELDAAQSAVSYAVAELERELGVKLLERGRFGARPTAVGERVALHVRQMLGLEDAVRQEANVERGTLQGTLRVATFRSVASQVMPKIIAQLRRSYPKLKVRLLEVDGDTGEQERAVHEGKVEVAFIQAPYPEDMLAWDLLHDPYVALVPKEHPLACSTVSRSDLSDSPLILYDDHKCSLLVHAYLQADMLEVTPSYTAREDSTIFNMVAQGLGISVVPTLAFEDLPDTVARVPLAEPLKRTIGIALLPQSLKVPAVRAFLGTLKKQFPESSLPELGTFLEPALFPVPL